MSAFSNYLEAGLLNFVFNENSDSLSTQIHTFVALFTGAPTDAGGGTEVTGGAYARKRVYKAGGTSPAWNAAGADGIGYLVDNANAISFTAATASWGTVGWFGIFTSSAAGSLLMHGALDASKVVGSGDTFKFPAGNLNLRCE